MAISEAAHTRLMVQLTALIGCQPAVSEGQ
jgi:hypothetical protein